MILQIFMKILRSQTGKRTESDTGKKNAQKVMISITIVEFAQIAGYGTKSIPFDNPSAAERR